MSRATGASRDVVVCLVWFVLAGVLGALAWWQLSPTVTATQTDAGPVLESRQLELQVGIDGWFGLVALVGGLVSGVVLLAWRSRRPELMVLLVALGAGLAAVLVVNGGAQLGPPDPTAVLEGAAAGTEAPVQLRLQASGLAWLWPAAALAGALVQLLVLRRPGDDREAPSTAEAGPSVAESGAR